MDIVARMVKYKSLCTPAIEDTGARLIIRIK